jgi:hypothetical protein
MKRTRRALALALLASAILFAAADASAQSGGSFDLSWSTIDGGGTLSSGGAFEVYGTVGQPDASVLSGGAFEVTGGFWNFETAAVPVELSAFALE